MTIVNRAKSSFLCSVKPYVKVRRVLPLKVGATVFPQRWQLPRDKVGCSSRCFDREVCMACHDHKHPWPLCRAYIETCLPKLKADNPQLSLTCNGLQNPAKHPQLLASYRKCAAHVSRASARINGIGYCCYASVPA